MDDSHREITKIAREVQRFTLLVLKNTELGTSEYECVHCIRHNPGISQETMRAKLNLDKAAATRQAQNLEKKGYIVRQPNPLDARSKKLYATEKANSVKESRVEVESFFYNWLLQELNDKERTAFLAVLDKLYLKSKTERQADFQQLRTEYGEYAKINF